MTEPATINWHGQEMASAVEIVKLRLPLGLVETAVEVPALDDRELRYTVALMTAMDRFDDAAKVARPCF